jgi:hypothetical protein
VRRLVQHTHIDGIGNGIVDELAENQTVSGLVKKLHRVRRDRDTRTNIRVALEDLWAVDRYRA